MGIGFVLWRCDMFEEKLKRLDVMDVSLIKLSVAAAVLFLVGIWPALLDLVMSVNPWYFLVAFVIFAVRPLYRFWK
jgi:hypothetical membrane protein